MKRSASLPAEKMDMLKESPTRLAGKTAKTSPRVKRAKTPPRVKRAKTPPRVERAHSPVDDNASTGSSSVPEELSVRTPLLELDTPYTVKTNTSIKVFHIYIYIIIYYYY